MFPDFRIAELAPNRQHRGVRAFLVGAHQTRIAGDIDRQNGRQPALDPLSAQQSLPKTSRARVDRG
jgi:hypothetical protein